MTLSPSLIQLIFCINLISLNSAQYVKTCNVTSYGAKGDGKTDNTKFIQLAINDCANASNTSPNDKMSLVVMPVYYSNGAPSVYMSGALWLQSNIAFYIETDVTLLGLPCTNASLNNKSYPWIYTRYNGIMMYRHSSLINGGICQSIQYNSSAIGDQCKQWKKIKNIKLFGNGKINGNGHSGWHYEPYADTRPCLADLLWIDHLQLLNLTFTNSPTWTVHPTFSSNIIIDAITVLTDDHGTDGIDVDSCNNVLIQNCFISTGDDCIAIKSGKDADGRAVGIPSNNMTIRNIHTLNGNGISIGSEMSGNVTNIYFENILEDGTQYGPKIKSSPCRGGMVENVTFSNFTLKNVQYGISIDEKRNDCTNQTLVAPIIRNIYYKNITGYATKESGQFECLKQSPCYQIDLTDVNITCNDKGYSCQYVHGQSVNVEPASCVN